MKNDEFARPEYPLKQKLFFMRSRTLIIQRLFLIDTSPTHRILDVREKLHVVSIGRAQLPSFVHADVPATTFCRSGTRPRT